MLKKIMNAPEDFVDQSLRGILYAHGGQQALKKEPGQGRHGPALLVRRRPSCEYKVPRMFIR